MCVFENIRVSCNPLQHIVSCACIENISSFSTTGHIVNSHQPSLRQVCATNTNYYADCVKNNPHIKYCYVTINPLNKGVLYMKKLSSVPSTNNQIKSHFNKNDKHINKINNFFTTHIPLNQIHTHNYYGILQETNNETVNASDSLTYNKSNHSIEGSTSHNQQRTDYGIHPLGVSRPNLKPDLFKVCVGYTRSFGNKIETTANYLHDHNLDMYIIVESCLSEAGEVKIGDLEENGYKLKLIPRQDMKGGSFICIHKSELNVTKIEPPFHITTMEFMEAMLTHM